MKPHDRNQEIALAMGERGTSVVTNALAAVSPPIARAVISIVRALAEVAASHDERPMRELLSPGGMANVLAVEHYVTVSWLPHFKVEVRKVDYVLPGATPTYRMTMTGEPDAARSLMTGSLVADASDAKSAATFMSVWFALRLANDVGALTLSIDSESLAALKEIQSLFLYDEKNAVAEVARKYRDRAAVAAIACSAIRQAWFAVTAELTSPAIAAADSSEKDAEKDPPTVGETVM